MANLIIKSSADNLVLQGSDASPAITVGATGTTTFAENATLSGTANALGTVATGNLSNNNIVMPRFKEYDRFLYTSTTNSTTASQTTINISGSNYLTFTPEHADDIIEFSFALNVNFTDGYGGYGIQKSSNTG